MKNKILIILTMYAIASSINAVATITIEQHKQSATHKTNQSSHKPLVEKGKTWWYASTCNYDGEMSECGITIGDQITLNGKNYNKIDAGHYITRTNI